MVSLCAGYNIEPAEIIAVGDDLNDVDMLSLAGLGVAMGSASATVQAAADLVIGSHDENGLADFIQRLVV